MGKSRILKMHNFKGILRHHFLNCKFYQKLNCILKLLFFKIEHFKIVKSNEQYIIKITRRL